VFVVWFPVLFGDSRELVDRRVLSDHRAVNFWDPNRLTGGWFSEHVTHDAGLTWDAYFLYGGEATWQTAPGPLVGSGSSVIGSSDALAAQLRPLLR
jgi:hypothetical protein